MEIKVDDLTGPEIAKLLQAHLDALAAITAKGSMHALDLAALRKPGITFWSAWSGPELLGCGALKELNLEQAELKSMRTVAAHLRKGVASAMVRHIIAEARQRKYKRLYLETGSSGHFAAAHQLYAKCGFTRCGPFEGYGPDPNSIFMMLDLESANIRTTSEIQKQKQGLDLNRVVLLGRTLEEYVHFFGLNLQELRGKAILDVASGVSSFTAEANAQGLNATAFDRIYVFSADEIQARCEHDLIEVARDIADKKVYRWDFYKSAEGMRAYRARAYQTFLADFRMNPARYIAGNLPQMPFANRQFQLTLASYLLFVYEDQLSYEFHRDTLCELLRVTSSEIRIYPTVTFEAEPSKHLARIRQEPEFADLRFEIVPTDFEFLRGSNNYLRITRG